MRRSRRSVLRAAAQVGLGLAAWGCASPPRAAAPAAAPVAAGSGSPRPSFNPVFANSEIVKGRNRFAMGLIGDENRPITDARVSFGFFQISGQQATKRSESEAQFRWVELEAKGLYVATAEFDTAGIWGFEVTAVRPGCAAETARVPFEVRERGAAPMIGDPAPRSKTVTAGEVPDPSEICSNAPPCELHALSLDDALANGKPSVVLFASPGFCVTATCAPALGVVLQARARQTIPTNFVHVEIYKDPRNKVLADAVTQWNLPSEPWIFVADRHGVIADRFEGTTTLDEVEAALRNVG